MDVILLAAVPAMLACFVIVLAMRGWVWSILREVSTNPQYGALYGQLNPDGFVFYFDARLLRILSSPASSVLSDQQRFWLRFYVASRLLGVTASLSIGYVMLYVP
jgi:hypothetical protein